MVRWRVLADAVVMIHAAYVVFVVFGLAAILVGVVLEWKWVRGFCFRLSHLVAVALVCLEAILGVMCPLTTLEDSLRARAGQARYPSDFIGYWTHRLIFYNAPTWIFTALYAAFTILVAATFWFAPPKWPRHSTHSGRRLTSHNP
jgi:hypothetical protein